MQARRRKGFYSLPGGRVEFGESLHAALHREVDEETALKIEIAGLAGWREVLPETAGGGHYLIMSFAARWSRRRASRSTRNLTTSNGSRRMALGDLKITGRPAGRSSNPPGACSGPETVESGSQIGALRAWLPHLRAGIP